MKRLLPWLLNIVLMFALAVGVALYLEDDGPSNATAPPPTTTTTTAPTAAAFISAGPHAKELREALAETDEIDLSEWDPEDWELSYVTSVAEEDELLVVVTGETIEALYPSTGCSGDASLPDGYFRAIFSKGDWVLWETKGDDPRICPNEIILVKEK